MSDASANPSYPDIPGDDSIRFSLPKLRGEAMSSWLRRVARQHGRSDRQMRTALGLRNEDVDFNWPWSINSTARFLAIPLSDAKELVKWRHSQISALGRGSVLPIEGAETVRVCRICALRTKVIFHTTEARLSFVARCPIEGSWLVALPIDQIGLPVEAVEFPPRASPPRAGWTRKFEKHICNRAYGSPDVPAIGRALTDEDCELGI